MTTRKIGSVRIKDISSDIFINSVNKNSSVLNKIFNKNIKESRKSFCEYVIWRNGIKDKSLKKIEKYENNIRNYWNNYKTKPLYDIFLIRDDQAAIWKFYDTKNNTEKSKWNMYSENVSKLRCKIIFKVHELKDPNSFSISELM